MSFEFEGEEDLFDQISSDLLSSIDTPEDASEITDLKKVQFQKRITFNKLLPYADKLDDEADSMLAKIKANLGRYVMLRNIKPGCVVWTQILNRYITLYDLRFSKEDHIAFVKLMYELVTIPRLESTIVILFSQTLIVLLRRSYLIRPSELELPWRPLYMLYRQSIPMKVGKIKSDHHPIVLKPTLECLIRVAKIYFPVCATQEILDEMRPELAPYNFPMVQNSMALFEIFLPILLSPENHHLSHELWFHEFMNLWKISGNGVQNWGKSILMLIARLAYNNIGYIDWEPYIPLMFTRFIQSVNFPVSYKKLRYNTTSKVCPYHAGLWITSVLGNNSSAQSYLEKFLNTIESYFHPANHGSWLKKIGDLFANIAYFVVLRLHRERYASKTYWNNPIPESHKLTDADIDAFVNSMKPIAMVGIFNKHCSDLFFNALHYLSIMRPKIIIPNILEKIYPSLGSDIEPHKLHTATNCLVTIVRSLVQGPNITNKDYAFQEGPQHVLPILFACLSGIDPNDPNKSFAAFRAIATYVTIIPIVDCSHSKAELSEDERLVSEETSKFEDFVLQFMDKVFMWIDSCSVETVRLENHSNDNVKSTAEAMGETGLSRVVSSLLRQASPSIFTAALNKLRSFIFENVMETNVAGPLVGVLCKVFTEVNGNETLKALLPILSGKVLDIISENDDVMKAERLDSQLLFPLLLLNRLALADGDVLLLHMDAFIKVIDKAVALRSREGNLMSCFMLSNLLQSLIDVSVLHVIRDLEDDTYPYIRDWGVSMKINDVKMKYYVPSKEAYEMAQKIFNRYFLPAIQKIEDYIKSDSFLNRDDRDDLQITLRIIYNILDGCNGALPVWSEPSSTLEPYNDVIEPFQPEVGVQGEITMPDGSNVRKYLIDVMSRLQEIMLKNVEDDTKCLIILELVWQKLLLGKLRTPLGPNFKFVPSYSISKPSVENKMIGDYGWFPSLILSRVNAQHVIRKACTILQFTESHKNIILHLLKLSTSRYSKIRIRAQETIRVALGIFPYLYKIILPHILQYLRLDPVENHDAYKGILYLILKRNSFQDRLLVKQDWEFVKDLWPALVLSKPSEKPSVIRLKDRLVDAVIKLFFVTNVRLNVPESCINAASQLWSIGANPSLPISTEDEIKSGVEKLEKVGEINDKAYHAVIDDFLKALLEHNLHWRHRYMAMSFLYTLINEEMRFPASAVRFFINNLINESIEERKLSIEAVMYILKQCKRKHPKIKISVPQVKSEQTETSKVRPGIRPDNIWLQYNSSNRPKNAAEWDEPRYIHKCHVGFYVWPNVLEIYAPSSMQPSFPLSDATNQEIEVEKFFTDRNNVDRLVEFLCLEEKKGRDKFSPSRMSLFKGLFRNHGDLFLGNFLPHLEELVKKKQESSQRCAAEIISGIIRGSKHWNFEMTTKLWSALLPIIRNALNNLTNETVFDWTLCVSKACQERDPNRLYWLIECIMEESNYCETESSFVECGRLLILQATLALQYWRVADLLHKFLLRFENRMEDSPLQSVRDRLSAMLVIIFRANFKYDSEDDDKSFPIIKEFVDKIYPRLESLTDSSNDSLAYKVEGLKVDLQTEDQISNSTNGVDKTREKNLRLFMIVCRWIMDMLILSYVQDLPRFYRVFPIICHLESNEKDEDIRKTCTRTLAVFAQTLVLPEHVPSVLSTVSSVSESPSWSVRANVLEFLQTLVFHNIAIILSREEWIRIVEKIVLRLLEDERLEVREKSAQVLGGLLHCTILADQDNLLEQFKKKAKTKLYKKSRVSHDKQDAVTTAYIQNAALQRHAGVLGMCAFILAHPYDVPEYVPPIFECLSNHLNDPEPIPSAIRKTLNNFKRTHCDGWTGLQGLAEHFTEEQFAVLQDLTVPPSYYA